MITTDKDLVKQYEELHKGKEEYGSSSKKYLPEISLFIDFMQPNSVLDYGCGKGAVLSALAEKYPKIKFYGYDPSIPGKNKLPTDKIDLVINTDVLEHVPAKILPNVLKEIASISKNTVFCLSHALAVEILPNGENAHCTVRPPVWYQNEIMKFFGEDITVFSGRKPWLSLIATFPVQPALMKKYYEILSDSLNYISDADGFKKKPHGFARLWKHLRKLKF